MSKHKKSKRGNARDDADARVRFKALVLMFVLKVVPVILIAYELYIFLSGFYTTWDLWNAAAFRFAVAFVLFRLYFQYLLQILFRAIMSIVIAWDPPAALLNKPPAAPVASGEAQGDSTKAEEPQAQQNST